MHNAWKILRKPSMALLYMPGPRIVDYLIHEFQPGFPWPFFTLVPKILSVADLTGAESTTRSRVQLYRRALGVWVVELRAGDRLFHKASRVENTLEFDKHLHTGSKETHILYMSQPSWRKTAVRERLKEIVLGTVTSSTPSLTDDSGSEDRTVKKPQGHRRLSPIPFPIPLNDTPLSPEYIHNCRCYKADGQRE